MTTGNMTNIARPYALAAFEFALAKKDLPAWEKMLKDASALVHDKVMTRVLASPTATTEQLSALFCEALAKDLDAEKTNFIRLLAEKKRLAALPDIAKTFKALQEQHEKTLTVHVTSAIALDDAYQQKLTKALVKRLQKQVVLQCKIDPTLLAGVMIRAGDMVIDGSVRGKLNRLVESL
jgi:F-type H+-transporting ATPase subunit delta